jgi:hypothetical protein
MLIFRSELLLKHKIGVYIPEESYSSSVGHTCRHVFLTYHVEWKFRSYKLSSGWGAGARFAFKATCDLGWIAIGVDMGPNFDWKWGDARCIENTIMK